MGGLGAVLAVFRTFAAAPVDDGAEVEDVSAEVLPDGVGRLAQLLQRFPAEGYQFFSGAGTALEHPGEEGRGQTHASKTTPGAVHVKGRMPGGTYRGESFPFSLFGRLFRGLVAQGLESGRGLVFPVQDGDGPVNKVTVFRGDVVFLRRVFYDVAHFPVAGFFAREQVEADDFLCVKAHGHLAAVAASRPNHGFPVFQGGFFTQQDGRDVCSEGRARIRSRQGAQRGHHVCMEGRLGNGFPRSDFSGPADDSGYADASFIELAFQAFQVGYGMEETVIHPACVVRGAVVAGEDDDGISFQSAGFQRVQQAPHIVVHLGNHAGIGGAGTGMGQVPMGAAVGAFVPFTGIVVNPFLEGLHGYVGFQRGIVQEKRFLFTGLFLHEFQHPVHDEVGTVLFRTVGLRQHLPFGWEPCPMVAAVREVFRTSFLPSFHRYGG